MNPNIISLVHELSSHLIQQGKKIAVAESCTGGGLAYTLTQKPGSSNWFDCGFITYSNEAKMKMLDVKPTTLDTFGAVSEQTAREMAEGAIKHSQANISLSITGIAGPDGGTNDKPVGMVWFAWSDQTHPTNAKVELFSGSRHMIRDKAIEYALKTLIHFVAK